MPTLSNLDIAIVFAYLVAVVAIGLSFARKEKTSEDFFLAGRKLRWPIIGASLFASNIGTEHLVGLAGEGHRLGLAVGGFEWMASICLIVLGFVFVPQYIRTRVYTTPEFLEKRFSLTARMYLSIYFTAMIVLTKVSIALWAGATVIHQFFPYWEPYQIMWGIGMATALYTAVGGLSAVVYTDVIQTLIFVLGSTLLLFFGLEEVGGWSGLMEKAPAGHLHMAKGMDHPQYPLTGFLFGNLFGGIFYWCMDQSIVQRALGARDLDEARKGAVLGGFLKILPVFLFVLPGVVAVVLFPDIAHDRAFPTLVSELLPVGIRGLVLAGLLAALMSSLDSTLNASATLVTRDFIVRFSGVEPSQRSQIWIGRATILVVVLAGIFCTPLIEKYDTLWEYLQTISAYMGMPIVAATLTGIFWKRGNNTGALSAMVVGIVLGLIMMWDTSLAKEGGLISFLQHPYLVSFLHRSILAFAASVAVMIGVSLATPPPPRERVEGICFEWSGLAPETEGPIWADYRLWMGVLFVTICCLWVKFA